jgi:hypothetical protein
MREESISARKRAEADSIYQLLSSMGYALYQIDETSRTLVLIKAFNLDDKDTFRGRDYIALES